MRTSGAATLALFAARGESGEAGCIKAGYLRCHPVLAGQCAAPSPRGPANRHTEEGTQAVKAAPDARPHAVVGKRLPEKGRDPQMKSQKSLTPVW